MENTLKSYHDVDVALPSQVFNVAFSYTTKESLDFIDSMVLRLLIIAPLSADKIAQFLELTNHETDVLLTNLLHREQIQHLEDGKFALTKQLEKAFTDVCAVPYVSKIEDNIQKMSFEMIGLNPEPVNPNLSDNGANSIKLEAQGENLSNSETLVYKEFQKNFRFFCGQDLVKLNLVTPEDEKNVQLYKMSQVEKLRDYSRRVTLNLTLDESMTPNELTEFNHLGNLEKIENALYTALKESKKPENIEDIIKVLNTLDLEEDIGIESIFSDNKLHLDRLLNLKHASNEYFIGPIYSKENADLFFEKINEASGHQDEQNPLYWLAPSDDFWGKSDRFSDFVDRLSVSAITKSFKCFLPVAYQNDKQSITNFKKIISAQAGANNCYMVNETSLNFQGNFEILVMKDSFCALIIHVSDPRRNFLTTVPVGIFISDKAVIQSFYNMFKEIESDEENFYGPLNKRK